MTKEEREALGVGLLDTMEEMKKYSAENEHYDELAKNLTAIAKAINEHDNGEADRELKERELEIREDEIKSEKKRGWIGIVTGFIGNLLLAGVSIWAYKSTTKTYDQVSKNDIPSKGLTKATDKARDNVLRLPNFK